MNITKLNGPLCVLGEGPAWNDKRNAIYYLDIMSNKIYAKQEAEKNVVCVWETDSNVGGIAFFENGDMAAFVKEGIKRLKLDDNGVVVHEELIAKFDLDSNERYNEIIVDPRGRIFAGTLKTNQKDGRMILFEKGKQAKLIMEGIGITNGMGFSLDEKYFYHTDTKPKEIKKYKYDIETGEISSPVCIYTGAEEDGGPDGLTIDANGDLWSACWGAFQVIHLTADGEIIERIKIESKQVASITFGGADMKKAYVTTAGVGADNPVNCMNNDGTKMGGEIYELEINVQGKKDYIANI